MHKNITRELECFCARHKNERLSVVFGDADTSRLYFSYNGDVVFPSASLIKVPVMLAALLHLELHERVFISAPDITPDSEVFDTGERQMTVGELIYWMTAASDNTAANVLIKRLTYPTINEVIQRAGMRSTVISRKMLDFDSASRGCDNFTSANDMRTLFAHLYNGEVFGADICAEALSTLSMQRRRDCLLRYVPDNFSFAHKTGELDNLAHDCGIAYTKNKDCFISVFVADASDCEQAKRIVGQAGKIILASLLPTL